MLGKVRAINDDAAGSVLRMRPAADEADDLPVDRIDDVVPADSPVVHLAIEHVLLAGEQLAKAAFGVFFNRLNGEEREQDEQFHHLDEGELAIRVLNRTAAFACMMSLSITVVLALIALLVSLCLKKALSSEIMCPLQRATILVVLHQQYNDNQ